MRFQKKHFIAGAVVLFLGFLAGSAVLTGSVPPRFCGRDFHPSWHGRGFHPRFLDQDFSEQILKRLDHGVDYLNLSETQKQDYEEIRLRIQTRLTEGMEERRKFFRELRSEIDHENADLVRVAALVKERLRDMPVFVEHHVDLFVEFYNILDEDQKAQLVEMVRERIGRENGS